MSRRFFSSLYKGLKQWIVGDAPLGLSGCMATITQNVPHVSHSLGYIHNFMYLPLNNCIISSRLAGNVPAFISCKNVLLVCMFTSVPEGLLIKLLGKLVTAITQLSEVMP